jgi:hypothetical protein
MALELGVSPHAIEKRLKMARAKLGVSSSLHAARLLVLFEEGYQRAGPEPSDLAYSPATSHPAPYGDAQLTLTERPRRTGSIIWGATMITILLAGALALGPTFPSQDPSPESPSEQGPERLERLELFAVTAEELGVVELSGEQKRAALVRHFAIQDRNRSGFIEAAEAPSAHIPGHGELADMWIVHYDSDGDGKVSQAEMLSRSIMVVESRKGPVGRPNVK